MKKQNILVHNYTAEDKKKVETLLSTLLPHLAPNKFILVGGLSTRYNCAKSGVKFPLRPLNDIDIIIENKEAILPSITSDFLVYHYHPKPTHNGSFYIALVFPNTKTKIDFFDYSNKPQKTYKVKLNKYLIAVQSAEDQLVNTAHQVQRISPENKVDPKQISDLKLLLTISDLRKARIIWEKKHHERYKMNLNKAIQNAIETASKNPQWLQVKPERKHEPYLCKDCTNTKNFPITPMEVIYKLMGYTK